MKKICFGNGIKAHDNKMCDLTKNIKGSLKEIYRFPVGLEDISNCFSWCSNLTLFEANIPDSVQNMSQTFYGCVNFYKNINIPQNCINMSSCFYNTSISEVTIPSQVNDISFCFDNSNIKNVYFETRTKDLDMMYGFYNCQHLNNVYFPTGIKILSGECAFINTNIKNIEQDLIVDDSSYMFDNCSNLCSIGNMKSNVYMSTFYNCSNLQSMGELSGNITFNNTFVNCSNYTNVIYLRPDSLSFTSGTGDKDFLKLHPLRIYGRNHSLEDELEFVEAHGENGTYMSGYCDIDDFNNTDVSESYQIGKYVGEDNAIIVIPKKYRANFLDEATVYTPNFYKSFENKNIDNIMIFGNSKFSNGCFANQNTNFMKILGNPNFINSFTNGDESSIGLKNCNVEFYGGPETPCFTGSGIKSFYTNIAQVVSKRAFDNCFYLSNVCFNNVDISEVKEYAFNNCSNAKFIENNTIPYLINCLSKTTNIGDYAFSNFGSSLTDSFKVSFSNANVGNYAFSNSGLNNIIMRDDSIFNNYAFSDSRLKGYYNLKNSTYKAYVFKNTGIDELNVSSATILSNDTFSGMDRLHTYDGPLRKDLFNSSATTAISSYPSSLINVRVKNTSQLSGFPSSVAVQGANFVNFTFAQNGNIPASFFSLCDKLENIKVESGYSVNVLENGIINCANLINIGGIYDAWGNSFYNLPKLRNLNVSNHFNCWDDRMSSLPELKTFNVNCMSFHEYSETFYNNYQIENICINKIHCLGNLSLGNHYGSVRYVKNAFSLGFQFNGEWKARTNISGKNYSPSAIFNDLYDNINNTGNRIGGIYSMSIPRGYAGYGNYSMFVRGIPPLALKSLIINDCSEIWTESVEWDGDKISKTKSNSAWDGVSNGGGIVLDNPNLTSVMIKGLGLSMSDTYNNSYFYNCNNLTNITLS